MDNVIINLVSSISVVQLVLVLSSHLSIRSRPVSFSHGISISHSTYYYIAENGGVHTLDLSWNQFRNVGAQNIAKGLKV